MPTLRGNWQVRLPDLSGLAAVSDQPVFWLVLTDGDGRICSKQVRLGPLRRDGGAVVNASRVEAGAVVRMPRGFMVSGPDGYCSAGPINLSPSGDARVGLLRPRIANFDPGMIRLDNPPEGWS